MKFKYRVQGRVLTSFVVRGLLFREGTKFDFCMSEGEVEFAKKNSKIENIIDLEPKIEQPLEPVLKVEPEQTVKEETVEKPVPVKKTTTQKKGGQPNVHKGTKQSDIVNKK